jgi:hypothetical protein
MSLRLKHLLVALMAGLLSLAAVAADAAERYALIVTGASGGEPYASKYETWRQALVKTLTSDFAYPVEHVVVLAEQTGERVGEATRDNVRSAVATLRQRVGREDTLLICLIGHGAGADGDNAKFSLVGPDLSSSEWGALLKGMPGQLVFVNSTGGSYPFLHDLADQGRIVITANDSAAQQYETVFPQFFIEALADEGADTDKNGKVSIWEAFVLASDQVRRSFEEKGQLATERPLLDDTGDGVGREAAATGTDSVLARITYLRPDPEIADTGDPVRTAALRRRAALMNELEQLRARRESMTPDAYETALEKLLLEIAQIDRRLRTS